MQKKSLLQPSLLEPAYFIFCLSSSRKLLTPSVDSSEEKYHPNVQLMATKGYPHEIEGQNPAFLRISNFLFSNFY